jgi:uncharacterized protein
MKADILYNNSLKYLKGQQCPKDEARAFSLNSEASRLGHADAVLAMGWFYLNGVGVDRNLERARKWYRDAARHGDTRAMFSLGQIAHNEGEHSEALIWFKRAYEGGHHRSGYFIGKHFWRGHGVNQDKKEAMRYFHVAASHKVKAAQRVLRFLTRKD